MPGESVTVLPVGYHAPWQTWADGVTHIEGRFSNGVAGMAFDGVSEMAPTVETHPALPIAEPPRFAASVAPGAHATSILHLHAA